ncbi:HAD-IIB family hydrolase [Microbacterium excoecariae]|uniref:HAD-IIB family hydrolase n=1 Tax=Microbacterium excoecariae TaxID=2715210 RepID=UPI001407F173|nr:HAD-IIB family hydrolase [Microbacterium excoecariae]
MTSPEAGAAPVPMSERAGARLVALDIDGTVLLEDESFSPGVESAVSEAVRRGHIVTLATGRSWEATHPVLVRLGLDPEFVVSANGATIMERDPAEKTGYRRHTIETFQPAEVLTHLEQHLPDANYMVELGDGTRLFTSFMDDWDLSRPNARQATIAEMKEHEVTRVVVVSPDHDNGQFVDFVEEMGLHQVSYAVGWSAWLDIAPQGIDKSTALEQVRGMLGLPRESVVVMGDGRNDIQMLEWARDGGGAAVVMGQAVPEVAECGSFLTGDVHEGGVAQAFARLGLAG